MKNEQNLLLELVKLGLGNGSVYKIPHGLDWQDVFHLAETQNVSAIALDGINKLFEKGLDLDIDFQTKMDWIGAAQQVEMFYKQLEANMFQLSQFYQKHGIKMMVLKGYGLSLNYPVPQHRAPGDIDIFLFGDQKRGDELVNKKLGIKIDNSHHHHTVFCFRGESVENHYDFLNVHVRKSNKRIEVKLKEMVLQSREKDGVYYPSPDFNAIYLLRHCAAHFASTKMRIRQVLDFGLFLEKHQSEISWDEYIPYIKQEGMFRFYNLMGLFCMRYLGFDASLFHGFYEDDLFERFCNEILTPEFVERENGKLMHSLSVKPRRWWHNRWKNRLCYPDSAWSEFAHGLWAKILKPSHFIQ